MKDIFYLVSISHHFSPHYFPPLLLQNLHFHNVITKTVTKILQYFILNKYPHLENEEYTHSV